MKRRSFAPSRLVNRNVQSLSGRSSMRLEILYWQELDAAAARACVTPSELVRRIELAAPGQQRTSAVRVWLLAHLRDRAEAAEHAVAWTAGGTAVIPALASRGSVPAPNAGAPDAS